MRLSDHRPYGFDEGVLAQQMQASGRRVKTRPTVLHHLAPLLMLSDRGLAGMDSGQLHAIAYAQARLFAYGFGISLVFFAGFCIVAGVLIYRSGFLPRTLGVMMAIAGLCYLINSFALFLAPALASMLFPYILMPCLLAELSLALWLLVKGIDVARLP
jgi:hypothetical protein